MQKQHVPQHSRGSHAYSINADVAWPESASMPAKTTHVIKNQNHRAAASLTWMTCLALDTTWHVNLCDST